MLGIKRRFSLCWRQFTWYGIRFYFAFRYVVIIGIYFDFYIIMAGPLAAAYTHQYPLQQYQLQRMNLSRRRRYNPQKQTSFNDDIHQTNALQSCLEALGNQPTSDDDAIRWIALEELEVLLNRWATSMRTFQNNNQITTAPSNNNKKWTKPKVSLIPFGSFRLGVHRNDADMDCLCLAPPTTSRGEFFTSLVKLLQDDVRVNQVHAITSAYTPVIKFIFLGLHVDLLFARLEHATKLSQHQTIIDGTRNEYMIDDTDLTSLDEASVRSLNGARVAQYILSVVPNVNAFRLTLRAIKEWALVHGLYSNVLGFLGGVNLAILVAWVCKRHDKNTSPPALLKAFFQTFAKWKWPLPVMLLQPTYQPPQGGAYNNNVYAFLLRSLANLLVLFSFAHDCMECKNEWKRRTMYHANFDSLLSKYELILQCWGASVASYANGIFRRFEDLGPHRKREKKLDRLVSRQ